MNSLSIRISMPVVLVIIVIAMTFYMIRNDSNQTNTLNNSHHGSSDNEQLTDNDPRNEVVVNYISLMKQEKYSEMKNIWPNANAGTAEIDPNIEVIPPDQIPETSKEDFDFTPLYEYHHDKVISYFGEGAWENVDFKYTKIQAPDGKPKWVEKSTGKEITFEESVQLNEQYWEKVLEENDWTEKDVFSPDNVVETTEEVAQREANYSKYIEGEPTEYIIEEYYERYSVEFLFGGRQETDTGEHQFKITITNKDGQWILYDMLTWNPPITEQTSEI